MKARFQTGILILLLIAAIFSVTGTIAYLSDEKEIEDTYTIGNVRIQINPEQAYETADGKDRHVLYPKVKNTGSDECYVKAEITIANAAITPYFVFITGENWTPVSFDENGIATVYYLPVLKPGLETPAVSRIYLKEELEVDGKTINDFGLSINELNVHVHISCMAVQTKYGGVEAAACEEAFATFEAQAAP